MFVRGVNEPIEFNRVDNSFYKGIVVSNNDPLQMFRVKIYIPELSNQPINDWLEARGKQQLDVKNPGWTNPTDSWADEMTFHEVVKYLPWAEPSFPLMGEGGTGYYFANSVISEGAHITDSCYRSEFLDIFCAEKSCASSPFWSYGSRDSNTALTSSNRRFTGKRGPGVNEGHREPMSHIDGAFAPAYFYEALETRISDHFDKPTPMTQHVNPYAYEYRPSKFVNKPKGVFGVPNVGTKVWVFHYNGDVNLPVYFGVRHDYREAYMINERDTGRVPITPVKAQPIASSGLDYPGYHENLHPSHGKGPSVPLSEPDRSR